MHGRAACRVHLQRVWDWYLTRAILRDGELNAAESDARFEVIAERIYERAGLRSP